MSSAGNNTHKRKRDDDETLPAPPQDNPGMAEAAWDKMTFRVSRIPKSLDHLGLSKVLQSLFKVGNDGFKIHSLASDASDETEPEWNTATIAFREIPEAIQSRQGNADDWRFDIPPELVTSPESSCMYFDTHFDGFTPLSPADQDEKHTIEYVFPHSRSILLNFQLHSSTRLGRSCSGVFQVAKRLLYVA